MLEVRRTTLTLIPGMLPLLLLGAAAPLVAQEDEHAEAVEAAADAAREWLELVDAGEYRESWEGAASAMKDAITPGAWAAAVGDARGPLEPFGQRTRISAQYTTELPNAPAGEYVVFRFRTSVAGERTVIETVVPMKEEGGWKVSGYFVRPE